MVFLEVKIYRVPVFLQQNSSYLNNFLHAQMFVIAKFLFDFRFKNLSYILDNLLSFTEGIQFCPLFGNRSIQRHRQHNCHDASRALLLLQGNERLC